MPTKFLRTLFTAVTGMAMGAAEVVPGFSGGTVALVAGIYPRLVANIRGGAAVLSFVCRGRLPSAWRRLQELEWGFLLALLVGMFSAIFALAGLLSSFSEGHAVTASALFLGLVAGGAWIAAGDLHRWSVSHVAVAAIVGAVTFVGLGASSGAIDDPAAWMLVGGAAIAVCAWILPGVSGAFLLLMLGLYPAALAAVSDRDFGAVALLAAGALIGLAVFATVLNWTLERWHDVVLAAMIGLLAGSTRVLWPWPSATGMGDPGLALPDPQTAVPALVAFTGAAVVVIFFGRWSRRVVVSPSEADLD